MSTKRIARGAIAFLSGAALLGGVAACSPSSGTTDDDKKGTSAKEMTTVSLRLDFIHTGKDAIFAYGIEQGFFADEGIDLKVEEGKGSATTGQTVSNGADDFGIVDAGTLITLASKDVPLTAVSSVFAQSSLAVLSPADDPVKVPADLEGKDLAITSGDGPSTLLPALFSANTVDADAVNLVNMQPPARATALMEGQVDANATSALIAATLEAKGFKTHVMPYREFGVQTPGWYLATSNKMLADNADLVERFVAATQKSVQATVDDPDAAIEAFIAKYPDANSEQARAELDIVLPLIPNSEEDADAKGKPLGYMSESLAKSTGELLQSLGAIDKARPVEDYLTNEFVK